MLNQKIKQLRIEKGLSQADVAKALHVSRQTISRWENGRNRPEMDNFVQMADLFEISVSEILPAEFKTLAPETDLAHSPSIIDKKMLDQSAETVDDGPSIPTTKNSEHSSFDTLIQLVLCFIGISIPILGIPIIIIALIKIKPAKRYKKVILLVGLCCLLVSIHNSYFMINDLFLKNAEFKIEKVD